jgi:ComF family protein
MVVCGRKASIHQATMLASILRRGAAAAQQFLFPPTCLGCRRLLAKQGALCPECWRMISFIERPYCEVLGLPFAVDHGEGALCADAIANPPPFARARAAVIHQGLARRLAHELKYHDRCELAPWMARWMTRAGAELIAAADLVIPVPLHRRRFLLRRFNQSAELARQVARQAGLPFEPGLVQRVRPTRQQVGLGARERKANVRGAFSVPEGARPRLKDRHVLLVDDVLTTGATVAAVATALKRAGAAEVSVLTFARVAGEPFQARNDASI